MPSGAWTGPALQAAAFWQRALALLVDSVLLVALGAVAMMVLPVMGGVISSWLYFAGFESSGWQATPGKRLMKLRVVDVNGVPLRFGRASLRYVCRFLSALPLGLGYLLAAFNLHRQALHDMLASTRVVKQ